MSKRHSKETRDSPSIGSPLPKFVRKEIEKSKNWINSNRATLCKILKEHKIVLILKSEGGPKEKYKAALIEIISIYFTQIPAVSIANLLLHFGEARICTSTTL